MHTGKRAQFSRWHGVETASIAPHVHEIGEDSFACCPNLTRLELHDGVKVIRQGAFMGAPKLKNVELPSGLEEIGIYAFYGCGLKTLNVPGTVKDIGWRAFRLNPLKSVTVRKGLKFERWSPLPRTPERCRQFWMCVCFSIVGLLGAVRSGSLVLKALCGVFGVAWVGICLFIVYLSPAFDRGTNIQVVK